MREDGIAARAERPGGLWLDSLGGPGRSREWRCAPTASELKALHVAENKRVLTGVYYVGVKTGQRLPGLRVSPLEGMGKTLAWMTVPWCWRKCPREEERSI